MENLPEALSVLWDSLGIRQEGISFLKWLSPILYAQAVGGAVGSNKVAILRPC